MYCFQIHVSPPFSSAPQGVEVWQHSVCCSSPPYCLHELPMLLLGGSAGCFNFSRLYFTLIVLSLSIENVSFLLPDSLSVGFIVILHCVGYSASRWLKKTLSWKNSLTLHLTTRDILYRAAEYDEFTYGMMKRNWKLCNTHSRIRKSSMGSLMEWGLLSCNNFNMQISMNMLFAQTKKPLVDFTTIA